MGLFFYLFAVSAVGCSVLAWQARSLTAAITATMFAAATGWEVYVYRAWGLDAIRIDLVMSIPVLLVAVGATVFAVHRANRGT